MISWANIFTSFDKMFYKEIEVEGFFLLLLLMARPYDLFFSLFFLQLKTKNISNNRVRTVLKSPFKFFGDSFWSLIVLKFVFKSAKVLKSP